jgi:hypothetical protein
VTCPDTVCNAQGEGFNWYCGHARTHCSKQLLKFWVLSTQYLRQLWILYTIWKHPAILDCLKQHFFEQSDLLHDIANGKFFTSFADLTAFKSLYLVIQISFMLLK